VAVCPSCGAENREEARFCDSCGEPVTSQKSTVTTFIEPTDFLNLRFELAFARAHELASRRIQLLGLREVVALHRDPGTDHAVA
jgi:predicted amidophosphoribosyltransferase